MLGPVFGIVIFLIWLAFFIGSVVGCIIFLMAAWRTMKAHEAIANCLPQILNQISRSNPEKPDTGDTAMD